MKKIALALSLGFAVAAANAGTITAYTDRATFTSAVGAVTVEDFTSTYHFPINGGVLNSSTAFGTLQAGDIKAGVTYSTPSGSGTFFNIDAGAGFVGGFLDGFNPNTRDLTVTFSPLVSAFGFDTDSFMSSFDLDITFVDGSTAHASASGISGGDMSFFGYRSSATDIQSVLLSGTSGGTGFAIDNFTFGGTTTPTTVPEPSALALLGVAAAGMFAARRKKRSTQA